MVSELVHCILGKAGLTGLARIVLSLVNTVPAKHRLSWWVVAPFSAAETKLDHVGAANACVADEREGETSFRGYRMLRLELKDFLGCPRMKAGG